MNEITIAFHSDYENYAQETRRVSQISRSSGGSPVVVAGYRNNSPSYASADSRFKRRCRLDRAAITLHEYEHERQHYLAPEQRSAQAVGETRGFTSNEVRRHEQYLFSEEAAHELFLAEEWSAAEGYIPFHRVLDAAKEGRSLGRPPEA